MTVEGVDYSYARPSPTALAAAGKKFAVRYGGPGSDKKHLHAAELVALRAAGLDVVANAEGSAGGYRGATAGVVWAKSAEAHFRGLGMAADRPIYFSVDWDATSADWHDVDAALRGSASVIGAKRVGVYGSYATVAHCDSANTAAWLWQTYAWSHGKRYNPSNMYQYHNGVTIGGGDVDLTRALTADYGQWGYKAPAPPEDDFMSFITNRAQFQAEMTAWAKTPEGAQALLTGLMGSKYGSEVYPDRTLLNLARDLHGARDFVTGGETEADPKYSKVTPDKRLAQMANVPAQVEDLAGKMDAIIAFIHAQQ
jgi:hypothetical protein